jgi:hypothetical protein
MTEPHVLWIDGVGGYAMCDQESVVIGGAAGRVEDGLRIMSDLPSRAAVIHRRGQDVLVEPIHRVAVRGAEISTVTLLQDGDELRLGDQVELLFSQPTQLSGTALLTLRGRFRWGGSIDGALILGQSCLIGPSPKAHVRCRDWKKDVVLFRHRDQWIVRHDEYLPDGTPSGSIARPVEFGKRIQGADFSMTWL